MEIIEAKNNLRSVVKKQLDTISFHQSFESNSRLISQNIFSLLKSLYKSNLVCGVFSPMGYEPNWLLDVKAERMDFALPKMEDNGFMSFHPIHLDQLKKQSGFSFNSESQALVPDLLLVPGLSFTEKGERLGRGKGYYDRYLDKNKELKTIGVCFEAQLRESIPTNEHDKIMNFVVTEERILSI